MWDCCCESVKKTKSSHGSGCILAHCMGLGKTLQVADIPDILYIPVSPGCSLAQHSFCLSHWQVVTFFHTVLLSDQLTFRTALVVCPLNTVLNWVYEFRKWQRHVGSDRVNVRTAVYIKAERFTPNGDTNLVWQVRHLVTVKTPSERLAVLQTWYREGGVMVMGYELYRILSLAPKTNNEALRKELKRVLVDPGWTTQEGHHLTQVWSRLSFHTLCSVCLFRSGLCGV